ncbi:MAG: cytochrome c oxidase assembly protein [Anaerolineales bacterium]|nr:cytochrome c oxidase assembly protein [Anaerolineales bacterium]
MHPLVIGLLGPWEWRPGVTLTLTALAVLYGLGWWRVRKASKHQKLASGWRLAAYFGGLVMLALALISPIDALGGQLLLMHMVQHKLLIMFAAPLLWLGNPFPIVLWALPARARHDIAGLLARDTWFRRILTTISQPIITWTIFLFVYIGWHDPGLYNLALRVPTVHNLEHISFFLAALLFWWPVVNGAPHLHKALPYWVRIVYLIAFVPPNAITGVAIASNPGVIYSYYESVPHIWGFTAIEDQAWGGAIMWIWSSEMMIQTAIIMLGVSRLLEERPIDSRIPSVSLVGSGHGGGASGSLPCPWGGNATTRQCTGRSLPGLCLDKSGSLARWRNPHDGRPDPTIGRRQGRHGLRG